MRDHMKESLDAYVNDGCPTGDFLKAVLSNDLMDALGRADTQSIIEMPEIVRYIYNEMPSGCHGSPEIVRKWLEMKAAKRGKR